MGQDVLLETGDIVPAAAFIPRLGIGAETGEAHPQVEPFARRVGKGDVGVHAPDPLQTQQIDKRTVQPPAQPFGDKRPVQIDRQLRVPSVCRPFPVPAGIGIPDDPPVLLTHQIRVLGQDSRHPAFELFDCGQGGFKGDGRVDVRGVNGADGAAVLDCGDPDVHRDPSLGLNGLFV